MCNISEVNNITGVFNSHDPTPIVPRKMCLIAHESSENVINTCCTFNNQLTPASTFQNIVINKYWIRKRLNASILNLIEENSQTTRQCWHCYHLNGNTIESKWYFVCSLLIGFLRFVIICRFFSSSLSPFIDFCFSFFLLFCLWY